VHWDKSTRLTVTAVVDDDQTIALIRNEKPREDFLVFGASLAGARRLRAIRITIEEDAQRAVSGRNIGTGLFWILVRRPSPLDAMPVKSVQVKLGSGKTIERQVRQLPFDEGPASVTPIGDPLTDSLPFGFYLRRDEILPLRTRLTKGPSAFVDIFNKLRAEADQALASDIVDRNIYGNAYWAGIGHPRGFRGAGLYTIAPITALMHLLTGDAKYAIACRHWLLRAARSDVWLGEICGMVNRPEIGENNALR